MVAPHLSDIEMFDEVWSNHEAAPTRGYGRWTQLLARKNVKHLNFDRLSRRVIRNSVQFEILSPPRGFLYHQQIAGKSDLNNNSIVLRVSMGGVSFLFTGDIMKRAESELVARVGSQGLRSTVLMIPHHGSRTSSSNVFLTAVAPSEAVISAGWQNRFRFPHGEVLSRLKSEECRIWCTANDGAVEVITDGKGYSIRAFRSGAP